MSDTQKLISWRDAATRYNRSPQRVRCWPNEMPGFPQPIRVGRKLYFRLTDLEVFEAQFSDGFGAKAD